ncbi:TPA: glycosyltransferase family 2 protein [Streptococcus agalactiae]
MIYNESSLGRQIKISVIVPVYNSKQYLIACVDSIRKQTYKNLEIILVNDGSTDGSKELCEEIRKSDERIKTFHKTNGGQSSARNLGILYSTGDLLGFVDSDDTIDPKMYETLLNIYEDEQVDWVQCNHKKIYSNGVNLYYNGPEYYNVLNKQDFLYEFLSTNKIFSSVCEGLLSRDLALKIKFREEKKYEDTQFYFDLIKNANKFVIISQPFYNYYYRKNSTTTSSYSSYQWDIIDICTECYYYAKDFNGFEEVAFSRLFGAYSLVANKIVYNKDYRKTEEFKIIAYFFKKNLLKIFKNRFIGHSRKLSVIVFLFFPFLYKILLEKYRGRVQ